MTTAIELRPEEKQLLTLAQAKRWLAEARSLASVLDFRDQTEAVRHYRQVAGDAVEACNEAAEIKVRAERRIGELLREMPKNEGNKYGGCTMQPPEEAPTLNKLGIEKTQSYRFQRLASLPESTFEQHLAEVKEQGEQITTAGLLRLAKGIARDAEREDIIKEAARSQSVSPGVVTDLDLLLESGLKFRCIYADPPWLYGNQRTRGATSNHYPGMTVEEIAAMPVAEMVADNAHLHMWTTNGFIEQTFGIMRAWGFEYKSMYVWVKPQMGLGNYWRVCHEIMLLGVRGSCPFDAKNLRSWGEFARGEHSAKPEQVRLLIERASHGPRLELFGRQVVEGWTVFGNQVKADLFASNQDGE